HQTAQARAILRGSDLARHADVINGRHVYEKASGQGHVAGDARSLLAKRLLGDLHDNVLTGLQHLRNELWAALRGAIAARELASLRARAEARPASAVTAATEASTIPAAAIGPLKARTRIVSDPRGIARTIVVSVLFARLMRRARFSRQEALGDFHGVFLARRR